MDQRIRFINDYLNYDLSLTDLCELYHISRKTGYKWIQRHQEEGMLGMEDRSRRPNGCPHQTADLIVEALIDARIHHPFWGAKKLLKILGKKHPDWKWPARSTVCDILARYGLVQESRRRRRPGHPGKPSTIANGPNELWCADFKGEFKMRDGEYCFPLTTSDTYSRYLLGCQALRSTACLSAKAVFTRLFQEYGLPQRIRTDNGVPFATIALGRLSSLSAWWIRLGILPELIEPGKPQQNGKHERMHRTLKDHCVRPPSSNRRAQQERFDQFRREYNEDRPHESLGQEPPASLYRSSPRPMPKKLPPLEYPDHFEKRLVSENGSFRWKSRAVPISQACEHEYVGLEEIDNGVWNVYFGPLRLGQLMEEHMKVIDEFSKMKRHTVLPMCPD